MTYAGLRREVPSARRRGGVWLGGLGLVVLGWLAGCDSAPKEATGAKPAPGWPAADLVTLKPETLAASGLEIRPVLRGEFRLFRDFPATVKPNENEMAEITALVRGRVVDVYVDLGQEVEAGALLAILYSSELGLAQSTYLKAKATLYVAEQAFKRARTLLDEKVIGQSEFQRREGELISARAEVRESADRLLLLGMTEDEIRKLERDQKIRSYVPLHAPFAGRIIARDVTRGEVVGPNDKLFAVANLTKVWVLADIPEKDIPYVLAQATPDRPVEVFLSAFPNEAFHGRVTYVGDVLNPETRTMQIRLEVPNAERRLKPEMFATIRIYSAPEPGTLMIPESAVQRDRDRLFVFVQRDPESFEARDVRLGESNGQVVKVIEGLQEGEPVVTKGAFLLKSHMLRGEM
ncbi:efflux RND transporter periplasmic adaptor subunit [Nitrospira sp. Kam-Ns4a]